MENKNNEQPLFEYIVVDKPGIYNLKSFEGFDRYMHEVIFKALNKALPEYEENGWYYLCKFESREEGYTRIECTIIGHSADNTVKLCLAYKMYENETRMFWDYSQGMTDQQKYNLIIELKKDVDILAFSDVPKNIFKKRENESNEEYNARVDSYLWNYTGFPHFFVPTESVSKQIHKQLMEYAEFIEIRRLAEIFNLKLGILVNEDGIYPFDAIQDFEELQNEYNRKLRYPYRRWKKDIAELLVSKS